MSAGLSSEVTESGSTSGAALADITLVDAPPGASSSLAAMTSTGGFHSGSASQSFASPVA